MASCPPHCFNYRKQLLRIRESSVKFVVEKLSVSIFAVPQMLSTINQVLIDASAASRSAGQEDSLPVINQRRDGVCHVGRRKNDSV